MAVINDLFAGGEEAGKSLAQRVHTVFLGLQHHRLRGDGWEAMGGRRRLGGDGGRRRVGGDGQEVMGGRRWVGGEECLLDGWCWQKGIKVNVGV